MSFEPGNKIAQPQTGGYAPYPPSSAPYAPNFPQPNAPYPPSASPTTKQPQPGGYAPPGFQTNVIQAPSQQQPYGQTPYPSYSPQHQSAYTTSNQAPYPPPNQPPYSPQNQPPYPSQNQPPYPPINQTSFAPLNQASSYPPGGYVPPGYQPVSQEAYVPPIVNQPQADGGWMSIPQRIQNCPPGLEYLTTIDQLLVKQKVELLEAFTGFETNNKYTIKNSLGQKVYWAIEENDCCTRNCCGPMRPFDMKILDTYKNQVIHLNRPLACDSCCFPCCLQKMEVTAPPGNYIGSIEQTWSILFPNFDIKNASGETVMRIEGPCCRFAMCGDIDFKILTLNGEQVGKISKQWSGLARELFTDADFFGITFPMDLDVRMKAVMLGACFLIDAMFFEKSGNRESDTPGMF